MDTSQSNKSLEKLFIDKQGLICPITQELFVDPDGRTFERSAIERWFRDHETNPLTMKKIPLEERSSLKSNYDVRSAVAEWKKKTTNRCLKHITTFLELLESGLGDRSIENEEVLLEDLERLVDRSYELDPESMIVKQNSLKVMVVLLRHFEKKENSEHHQQRIREKRNIFTLQVSKSTRNLPFHERLEYVQSVDTEVMEQLVQTVESLQNKIRNQTSTIDGLGELLHSQREVIHGLVNRVTFLERKSNQLSSKIKEQNSIKVEYQRLVNDLHHQQQQQQQEFHVVSTKEEEGVFTTDDDDESELDILPIKSLPVSPTTNHAPTQRNMEFVPCRYCHRTFSKDRIERHERVHKNNNNNFRVNQPNQEQRKKMRKRPSSSSSSRRVRNISNSARKTRRRSGGRRRKRRNSVSFGLLTTRTKQEEEKKNVKCKYCGNYYDKRIAELHIPKCAEYRKYGKMTSSSGSME